MSNTLVDVGYVESEIEAQMLQDMLLDAEIPHIIKPYGVSGYGMLLSPGRPWGKVMSPPEYAAEIAAILKDLHRENP